MNRLSRSTRLLALAAVAAAALAIAGGSAFAGSPGDTGGAQIAAGIDTGSAIVQLNGDPLSTYAKTKPAPGKKIDFDNSTVKAYRAQLNVLRNDFKQWLKQNAPSAKITGEFDISVNAVAVQLNGTPLSAIAAAPQVRGVSYEGLYTPQVVDPDLTLINAFNAWTDVGGSANAGRGVKVGILDTGIDITHPCFNDTGYSYPSGFPKGDTSFTNKKVIVAKVFNNKAGNKGYTPEAVQAHGTHVSGTVACDYGVSGNPTTTVDGVLVGYGVNGVAPAAWLGNYNIFPDEVGNARSEDILNALDAAYQDGMDIVNMSIGGSHGKSGNVGFNDLVMDAVNDLDQAGMVSAIAAGNSGPRFNTVESPGAAARALTAGAVTVGHYIGVNVTNDTDVVSYAAAVGQFGPTADATGPLSANLGTYCAGGGTHTGEIALIDRGTCTFSTKIRNAQDAGAVGAIIVNNVFGPPTSMAQDGTANQPTIPGVMVSRADRAALSGAGSTGDTFTIHSAKSYVQNAADNDYLAGFSSRGPTDVDFRVKPDVTAPGVNVLSSIPGSGPESCFPAFPTPCWAFFQGTSMATPHLAGSAAVVLGDHPTWSSWQVRSAVVNTADTGTVKDGATNAVINDPNAIGSGRENLDSAVNATLALDPVSVSFGAVPSGSGQTATMSVTVANLTGAPIALTPSVGAVSGTGVAYTVSGPASVAPGASATLNVTMTEAQGASPGSYYATLTLGGGAAHAALFTWVKT
jgi:minor extracellular serine protease Vpr